MLQTQDGSMKLALPLGIIIHFGHYFTFVALISFYHRSVKIQVFKQGVGLESFEGIFFALLNIKMSNKNYYFHLGLLYVNPYFPKDTTLLNNLSKVVCN